MLEYAGSQRAGLQAQRAEGVALVSVLRSIDWMLLAGVAALVGVGLWAIAASRTSTTRAIRTTTSTARSSMPPSAASG